MIRKSFASHPWISKTNYRNCALLINEEKGTRLREARQRLFLPL